MHAIRHQSDAATNARLRQKQRHAEPIPQRDSWGLNPMRVVRAMKANHPDEPMWPSLDYDPMRPWTNVWIGADL